MLVRQLNTVSAEELMSKPLKRPHFVVEGLIPQGVTIFGGAAKIGKSWLMLWLATKVAKGESVWGLKTNRCDVLYLSLEDTKNRIQSRLFDLVDEAPEGLEIETSCERIGSGLEEQLELHIKNFPKTGFVIIDTFQKVRDSKSAAGKNGMYAGDYDDISALKSVADRLGIAIVVVHHLRKLKDGSDPFNDLTGSTGITGAVDTSIILNRGRGGNEAILMATGRDIEYTEFALRFNDESYVWELVERLSRDSIRRKSIPPFLGRLVEFMKVEKHWCGKASDLLLEMFETDDLTPNVAVKLIKKHYYEVLEPRGITYECGHKNTGRYIKLDIHDDCDDGDGKTGI